MTRQLYYLTLTLAGCAAIAATYLARGISRRRAVREYKEELRTWEGEGGSPAPIALRTVQAA